ncbi:hypothetical protein ACIBCN_18970 [Nocardia sp. NPDC051052]|uniref:hypothetical protein n=1 Tax=Nocardia sp. NPDC051052 TaxID=3364322 RepID=UPI0037AF52BE
MVIPVPDRRVELADDLSMRIAVAGILADAAKAVFDSSKTTFAGRHLSGERRVVTSHRRDADGNPIRLGQVSVMPGNTTVAIVDIAVVAAWLVDTFKVTPDEVIEHVPQLTAQWKKTVEEAAKKAAQARQPLPPGVTVATADPHGRFDRQKGIDGVAEVAAMIRDQVMALTDVLALAAAPSSPEEIL